MKRGGVRETELVGSLNRESGVWTRTLRPPTLRLMNIRSVYEGKVAIITGGASGLGAAIARELASQGATVVLADRQVELAESLANEIRERGGTAVAMECDVRKLHQLVDVVETTVTRFGGVHFFFNNAGIICGGEADVYEPQDWDDVIDVNIRGVAYGVQAVYPVMLRQKSGHIINTASMAGLLATPSIVNYCTSKHAVVGLSKSLRIEAKRHGVRVSALCPGVIRTPILSGGKYGRTNTEGVSKQQIERGWEHFRPMEPGPFAQKVAIAVARNEAIIVVPGWYKAFWLLDRLAPTVAEALTTSIFIRRRAEIEAMGALPTRKRPREAPVPVTNDKLS